MPAKAAKFNAYREFVSYTLRSGSQKRVMGNASRIDDPELPKSSTSTPELYLEVSRKFSTTRSAFLRLQIAQTGYVLKKSKIKINVIKK